MNQKIDEMFSSVKHLSSKFDMQQLENVSSMVVNESVPELQMSGEHKSFENAISIMPVQFLFFT
jgi:hypothetical protein